MNTEQLQAIKERAKYATDGPWKVVKSEDSGVQIGTAWEHGQLKAGVPIVTTEHGKDGVTVYINHVNAEFIAHAREDIPALIAEVERLQERLALSEKCYGIMEKCAFKLSDRMDRMELSEAKARFTLERMDNTSIFRAIVEIDRLQAALEFYADIEKYQHTIQGNTLSRIDLDAGHVAAKALAGESNAI